MIRCNIFKCFFIFLYKTKFEIIDNNEYNCFSLSLSSSLSSDVTMITFEESKNYSDTIIFKSHGIIIKYIFITDQCYIFSSAILNRPISSHLFLTLLISFSPFWSISHSSPHIFLQLCKKFARLLSVLFHHSRYDSTI